MKRPTMLIILFIILIILVYFYYQNNKGLKENYTNFKRLTDEVSRLETEKKRQNKNTTIKKMKTKKRKHI